MTRAVVLSMIVIAALGVAGASLADRDRTAWSPVVYPLQRLPLVFSHAKHLARGAGCADCHPAATTSRSADDNLLPTEAACHDRSECVACHQGVVKPLEFHPANYLLTHAVEARRGKPDCTACHRTQSFCVGCHEREGIGTRGDTQYNAVDPARAFHPPGWASTSGGRNLHAGEARRNLTSCTSCHRETDCLACHSAQPGGPRASPHPAGWRSSARCKALDRGNRRMCLRCHIAQSELGCDWSAAR